MMIRHEVEELALLYALGVLEGAPRRAFEAALQQGSAEHVEALRRAGEVLVSIESAGAMEAPEGLRDRIGRLAIELAAEPEQDGSAAGFRLSRQVASDAGDWKASLHPGCWYRLLYRDPQAETVTYLLRMEPGAKIPPHRHVNAAEQCWVPEGDVVSAGVTAVAGDFFVAEPSTTHDWITTVNGNLQLIVGPTELEFVQSSTE
jgi:anti-sigma factor ChrR (cupin superfamily)